MVHAGDHLADWMRHNKLAVGELAEACWMTRARLETILATGKITPCAAELLTRGTAVPDTIWLALAESLPGPSIVVRRTVPANVAMPARRRKRPADAPLRSAA